MTVNQKNSLPHSSSFPPDLGKNVPRSAVQQTVSVEFSGPLPPPAVMERYEAILPGAAERLMQEAEKASAHERIMNEKALTAATREAFMGQIFAFGIGTIGIIASVIIAIKGSGIGSDIAAAILGGGTLASMVTIFIKGRER